MGVSRVPLRTDRKWVDIGHIGQVLSRPQVVWDHYRNDYRSMPSNKESRSLRSVKLQLRWFLFFGSLQPTRAPEMNGSQIGIGGCLVYN